MGILCSDMCDHRDLWRSCAANARLIHVLEADLRILVLRGSVMEIMGSGHNNTVLHNRNIHYVRQQQRDGVISLEYINSADNPADLFTKVLDDALFTKHRDVLVTDPPGGPCYGDDAAPAATACAMSRNHPMYGDAQQKKLKFCTTRPIWMGSTSYKRTCSRCTGQLSGRALAVL